MNTEIKKLPRGQVELTVTLTNEEYQPFLKQAATHLSQHSTIPGFRPGKADYEVIVQRVGEGKVYEEAFDPAVRKTLVDALTEHKLMTVGSPRVDVVTLVPGNPIVYKVIIDILPEVKLPDISAIKIKKEPVAVDEAEVAKSIERLREMRASEKAVDRAAQKGDKVEIDFKSFLDHIPVENGASENYPLVIGEGNFIPGFEDNLVGLKSGEEKKFKLEFPKEYHEKMLAGKEVDFTVTIKSVLERELPELNEDFAKSLGGFGSMKDIEDKMRDNLVHEATHAAEHKNEEAVLNALIEKSTFGEIPDALIDAETRKMINELEHNIQQQGLTFEDYLTHLKKTRGDLMLDFAPQALIRVKSALLLREVANVQKIVATDADVQKEIEQTIARYAGNPDVEQQITSKEYKDYLMNVITSRKTMEYLSGVILE
ncbi:MAG: trigger factor [Candidatus Buchananbacteria bacterium]|nr:trigger factor [Candidatus Buchananbacteria bacterium]